MKGLREYLIIEIGGKRRHAVESMCISRLRKALRLSEPVNIILSSFVCKGLF